MKGLQVDLKLSYKAFIGLEGLYGYKDAQSKVVIPPMYLHAQDFTQCGYAVVQNSTGRYGVIDTKNTLVRPFSFDRIVLHNIKQVSLMHSFVHYKGHERFWKSGYFSNLLEKEFSYFKDLYPLLTKYPVLQQEKVEDLKTGKTLVVFHQAMPVIDTDLPGEDLLVLNKNLILINNNLYKIKKDNLKKIVKDFVTLFDSNSKAVSQVNPHKVTTFNMKGKAIASYEILPSSSFTIYHKGKEYLVEVKTKQSKSNRQTIIYRDTQKSGRFYVNGAFEMYLPPHLTDIQIDPQMDLVDIWQNITHIDVLSDQEIFLLEVKLPVNAAPNKFSYYRLTKYGKLQQVCIA
ncbi:WG repeat-containing protein [Myroides sp. LJL119]